MTTAIRLPTVPRALDGLVAAVHLAPSDISVIIPVKDNQVGLDRLLARAAAGRRGSVY